MNISSFNTTAIENLEQHQSDHSITKLNSKLSNENNLTTTSTGPTMPTQQPVITTSSNPDNSLSSLSASLTAAFVQQMSQNTKPILYSFVTLEGNKNKIKKV